MRDAAGHVSANPFSDRLGRPDRPGQIATGEAGIDATVEGALAELGAVAEGVSGPLQFSATASGSVSAPDVSLSATSPRIAFMGREVSDVKLSATGKADPANPAADMSLTGTFGGEALSAKGAVAVAGGRPAIKGLELALGANQVSGDLQLGANFLPGGQLALDLPDIAPLAALAGETVSGDLTGTVRLDAADPARASSWKHSRSRSSAATWWPRTRRSARRSPTTWPSQAYRAASAPAASHRGRLSSAMSTWRSSVTANGRASTAARPSPAFRRRPPAAFASPAARPRSSLQSGEATVSGIKAGVAQPSTIRIAGGSVNFDAVTLDVNGATAVISGSAGAAYDLSAIADGAQ